MGRGGGAVLLAVLPAFASPEPWHAQPACAEEFAFVVPTSHDGETVTRFAIVNPLTSEDDIAAILDTMA